GQCRELGYRWRLLECRGHVVDPRGLTREQVAGDDAGPQIANGPHFVRLVRCTAPEASAVIARRAVVTVGGCCEEASQAAPGSAPGRGGIESKAASAHSTANARPRAPTQNATRGDSGGGSPFRASCIGRISTAVAASSRTDSG